MPTKSSRNSAGAALYWLLWPKRRDEDQILLDVSNHEYMKGVRERFEKREEGQSEACDTDGVESEADYRRIGSTLPIPHREANEQ